MSQTAQLTPPPAAPAGWKHFVSLDNRYIAPIFITCILLVGHLSFGILESYQKTAAGDRGQHRDGADARPHLLSQVGASGERVHQRDQRGNSAALTCLLALCPVRGHLHHVQICAAHQRPPYLEPVQLRHLGDAFPGPGNRGQL